MPPRRARAAEAAAEPVEPAGAEPSANITEAGIKGLLPGSLREVVDDADSGPFANDGDFLRTLEALTSLEVTSYKLGLECQQRVVSFASRDFADSSAVGVQRALEALPLVREWVAKLRARLTARGALPMKDRGLPPRFVRTCDVYELSDVERKIFAALLMMRSTHAFSLVKLNGSVGYGGGGALYGSGSKPGVTLAAILGVSLTDVSGFQKAERKHVKQGVVTPGVALITELPNLQSEAVLLLLSLPLSESQLFNIEKTDLMRVLREEPDFDEAKLAPKKRRREGENPPAALAASMEQVGGPAGNSLYSLLQQEVAAEANAPPSNTLAALNGVGATAPGVASGGEAAEAAGQAAKAPKTDKADAASSAAETVDTLSVSVGGTDDSGGKANNNKGGKAKGSKAKGGGKEGGAADGKDGAISKAGEKKDADEEAEELVSKPRSGPYDSDLEYLQDMFQLVKLRADIARVRRHMEERGQQMANTRSGNSGEGGDEEGSDDDVVGHPSYMDEGYWGTYDSPGAL